MGVAPVPPHAARSSTEAIANDKPPADFILGIPTTSAIILVGSTTQRFDAFDDRPDILHREPVAWPLDMMPARNRMGVVVSLLQA